MTSSCGVDLARARQAGAGEKVSGSMGGVTAQVRQERDDAWGRSDGRRRRSGRGGGIALGAGGAGAG
ncbi:hypothetical protein PR202_ga16479 [Eleusine coracana subsp. coracana]|uniref:Uncharacterized protein n=1 Tax=Eleusine coracana subsp. coracana TaxID=191504 RepID=A0AAV5CLR0_ELECO|nr:hypothetical protein PR202_ga16479 [Eleusine coracana subsp. coracana]